MQSLVDGDQSANVEKSLVEGDQKWNFFSHVIAPIGVQTSSISIFYIKVRVGVNNLFPGGCGIRKYIVVEF